MNPSVTGASGVRGAGSNEQRADNGNESRDLSLLCCLSSYYQEVGSFQQQRSHVRNGIFVHSYCSKYF